MLYIPRGPFIQVVFVDMPEYGVSEARLLSRGSLVIRDYEASFTQMSDGYMLNGRRWVGPVRENEFGNNVLTLY